jgi:hypothetical protein
VCYVSFGLGVNKCAMSKISSVAFIWCCSLIFRINIVDYNYTCKLFTENLDLKFLVWSRENVTGICVMFELFIFGILHCTLYSLLPSIIFPCKGTPGSVFRQTHGT